MISARIPYPDDIVRAADTTITLPVYEEGSLKTPASGTITIKDESDTEIVSAAAVVIVDGVASYTVTAATVPDTLSLSDRWMEYWTLVIDGTTHVFRRPAALVLDLLYPVLTDQDMLDEYTEVRRWLAEDRSSLSNYIDAAWRDIVVRLIEDGRRPYLILSPYSLRPAHMHLAASKAFRDFGASASKDGKYSKMSETEYKRYTEAWSRMTLRYDYSEDGLANEAADVSSEPVTFLAMPTDTWGWS